MKVNGVTKWIMVNNIHARSLFNMIADGVFKDTTAGKDAWRSLMDNSLLQKNCNKEGFNLQCQGIYGVYVKVRIGLVTNYDNCRLCRSCVGFGTWIRSCEGYLTSTSCGTRRAGCGGNPNGEGAAFGYILVQ